MSGGQVGPSAYLEHCHVLERGVQGEGFILVVEHCDGGQFQAGHQVADVGGVQTGGEARKTDVGLATQAEGVFVGQHFAAAAVDILARELAVAHGMDHRLDLFLDAAGHQQQVVARLQGTEAHRAFALHALHGQRVGKDQSLEAQLAGQQVVGDAARQGGGHVLGALDFGHGRWPTMMPFSPASIMRRKG